MLDALLAERVLCWFDAAARAASDGLPLEDRSLFDECFFITLSKKADIVKEEPALRVQKIQVWASV